MSRPQKGISGKGNGKWQSLTTLAKYRKQRNKAKKLAKKSRRR